METIIGADEFILHVRKNGRALNVSNQVLGTRILNLILGLGGRKHIDNHEALWDISANARNVNVLGLPQTSEQYMIPYDQIEAVYREIDTW